MKLHPASASRLVSLLSILAGGCATGSPSRVGATPERVEQPPDPVGPPNGIVRARTRKSIFDGDYDATKAILSRSDGLPTIVIPRGCPAYDCELYKTTEKDPARLAAVCPESAIMYLWLEDARLGPTTQRASFYGTFGRFGQATSLEHVKVEITKLTDGEVEAKLISPITGTVTARTCKP